MTFAVWVRLFVVVDFLKSRGFTRILVKMVCFLVKIRCGWYIVVDVIVDVVPIVAVVVIVALVV